jgi:NAD(P)-dependent dehydrogenase (short-subunit alcohol dehydrogenase family)
MVLMSGAKPRLQKGPQHVESLAHPGSSRGLGRDLAEAVLRAGERLIATARQPEQLRELVQQYGDRVRPVALDVTVPASARAAVAQAISSFDRLDVVVNNAGYANVSSIEDVDEQDFRAQIETNFFGVVNVTRAAIPVLRAQRSGHVIQISSIGGRLGSAGLSAYQSAKWAVEGFSEVLLKEVGPLGIRVTIVEPGGIRTDWAGSSMRVDPFNEAYQPTVGAIAGYRSNPEAPHGDPAKGAQAILKLAALKEPPLRLLLGSDAVFLAKAVATRRAAEDEEWRALSLSTDADGVPDFTDTPIGKLMSGRS